MTQASERGRGRAQTVSVRRMEIEELSEDLQAWLREDIRRRTLGLPPLGWVVPPDELASWDLGPDE